MPETVYRSTHPDVLTVWRAAEEQADKVISQRSALLEELGLAGHRSLTQGPRILGIEYPRDVDPPAGWRRDREIPTAIVPHRRTKTGADIGRRLDQLTLPDPRRNLPGGMPHMVWPDNVGRTYWPGVRLLGDALFVTWGCDPETDDHTVTIDLAVWERVRLSAYYLAIEAAEDAQEARS
ncbi:hypothetical protein [Streptosporangium sp. NPDC051022]|uniref:hypothetical protein n=1 Tax=Streptosporangium sp. NPDC051022 TaxID=3155752 RepID=UPI00342C1576